MKRNANDVTTIFLMATNNTLGYICKFTLWKKKSLSLQLTSTSQYLIKDKKVNLLLSVLDSVQIFTALVAAAKYVKWHSSFRQDKCFVYTYTYLCQMKLATYIV